MKKFSYWSCLIAALAGVIGMIVCITSAVVPRTYHPLWVLSAILFGIIAVAMSMIANIYRTGFTGWQKEQTSILKPTNNRENEACQKSSDV